MNGGEADAETRGLDLDCAEFGETAVDELAMRTTVAAEGTSKNQKSGQRAVVVYALVCPFKGVIAQLGMIVWVVVAEETEQGDIDGVG